MYVYEEQIDGKNLSSIINETHENVKYLPNIKLPENLKAVTDVAKSVENADILFLVLPFQFVERILTSIKGNVKEGAYAVTLAKGVYYDPASKDLLLLSQIAKNVLQKPCYSMMGANIATEVALEHLCETTVGCDNAQHTKELKQILSCDSFLVQDSMDVAPVEMLGALKVILLVKG